jgi:hypothetical protein
MTSIVRLRRSNTPGKVPLTTQLSDGEIVINSYDGVLHFMQNVAGSYTIVTLGSVATGLLSGLSTASNAAVAVSDSMLTAIGKLQAQVDLKAAADSPQFSGRVSVPTVALDDNTTNAASTAYVVSVLANANAGRLNVLQQDIAIDPGAFAIITPATDFGYQQNIGRITTIVRVLDPSANSATFNMKVSADGVSSVAYTANTILVYNEFTQPLLFDILLQG